MATTPMVPFLPPYLVSRLVTNGKTGAMTIHQSDIEEISNNQKSTQHWGVVLFKQLPYKSKEVSKAI